MFVLYAISNIAGTLNIKDEDFISRNKNYLEVKLPQIDVEQFLQYEQEEDINYILPGNSEISFAVKFDEYYQTSNLDGELKGSLSTINMLNESDIIEGRFPQNDYEIVIDTMSVSKMLNSNSGISHAGIKSASQLLEKEVAIPNMKNFKIVGIVDLKSPSIYTKESVFNNILCNAKKSTNMVGIVIDTSEEDKTQENIVNYELKLDTITLKKGRLPENDYEVIVNVSNQNSMKLNRKIKTTINGTELIVVGYYDSETNDNSYLVNENTAKYKLISESQNLVIYPKDEEKVIKEFDEKYNLFVENIYQNDKNTYLKEKSSSIKSAIIFAGIILVISLVEIYLMMRSSFLSRIKEIGILRAIGVKKSDIYKMFMGETIAITTSVSILGIIIMSYILNCLTQVRQLSKMYVLNFKVISLTILIIYVFNIIVGLLPLFRVLRKTPAQILSRHDVE